MGKLILLRHGKSVWNKKNIFTGWVDIPLSAEGIDEALQAGEVLKQEPIDIIFTSTLARASMTAFLALAQHASGRVPVLCHDDPAYAFPEGLDLIPMIAHEALNERRYGDLQGKDKQAIKEEFGEQQFLLWRRSYDTPPPHGESLKMTAERTLPYFHTTILPLLQEGKNVLISAHGNSLRALIMEFNRLTPEQVVYLEIPTGQPIFYTYREGQLVQ